MAKAVQKIKLSPSARHSLQQACAGSTNVRRTKAGISIEDLAEDIARRSLLQSLNVRPISDAEGQETGMFEVPAGGRRYRALELLVKQKRLAKTAPVPCIVSDSTEITAEEDSLAENVHRVALHPLDQFSRISDVARARSFGGGYPGHLLRLRQCGETAAPARGRFSESARRLRRRRHVARAVDGIFRHRRLVRARDGAAAGYAAVTLPAGTPIWLSEGILFATYATLRTDERGEKLSRVRQIVEWLGSDPGSQAEAGFDGVIVFDESHAMQNAVGGKGERGDQAASQQGRAGLRLQHALPNARVVYVSATGATTVHNLAYAQRLGLWGGNDFPFLTRAEFVEAIEEGGVAAMEVLARDLKALGLYAARSLSYEGVEYELVEHQLTPEQIRIYDAYAGAFSIIHNNLDAAMRAANITGETGTLNAQARSAARSAFESAKQRFFGHLLTSMKTPSLIRSIERDLDAGHTAVIQIVSTGEALMERRLAEIPTEDWGDVQVDITPREYVLDYLAHSFPVQLYEPFTDSEGNLCSRPLSRDGQPVESREAVARRDRLIEKLASLPPVPGALDQIVQRFGADVVAEVTGRSRRIIRKGGRLLVENRAASANLAETAAFMDDAKRILVFSDAGGTGRSYHAELSARNRKLRVHYLLEPGWKADAAIQGLGPHQPHQPGAAAAVPANRYGREGRKALSLYHRPPSRHAGRDHARPAPDRRPGPVQTPGQPRKPLRPRRTPPALSSRGARQGRRLLAREVRGRDQPQTHRYQRHQGRTATDHHLPQPAAGAHHRPAERPVHSF